MPLSEHQVLIMMVAGNNLAKSWAPLKSKDGPRIFELSKLDEIPQNWPGATKDGASFSIKLTGSKKIRVSEPYVLPLNVDQCRGKKLFVEVRTNTGRMIFSLLDDKNAKFKTSPLTGPDGDNDSIVVDIPPDYFDRNRTVKIQFARGSERIEIQDIIVGVDEN